MTNKSEKGLGGVSLKGVIDKTIIENNEYKERKYFYASDVYQCQRKICLEFKGFKAEHGPRTLNIFNNGHSVHERIARYFEKAGLLKDEEVDIPRDELNIHGRLDILFKDPKDKVVKIGEIKSINLRNLTKPKEEHEAQILIYMHYTGFHKGKLIYESKQTQELFFFDVEYDEEKVEKILGWFKELKLKVDSEELPSTKKNPNQYPCNWNRAGNTDPSNKCPFYEHCWV